MRAQGLLQALEAVLVIHLHAARVVGDTQIIGYEDNQRLRIGRFEVAVQRCELVFFCAARVKLPNVAHKDYLEGRHERGSLRAVEHFKDAGGCEVEIGEAEISEVGGNKGLQDRGAAAVEQKYFVAGKHVPGAK